MNTQTHILLAAALFARRDRPLRNIAALAGGLIPDASIFVMWGYGKLAGVPERAIWNDMYWRPEWQEVSAITNSVPLFAGLALASAFADRPARDGMPGSLLSFSRSSAAADAVLVLALAAIVHIATDMPLHVYDGHPPFWPVSGWIFQSGISYWDPQFYGDYVSLAELALATALIVVLWRRFRSWIVRGVLLLAGFSFAALAHHWATAF
jgi:membrane-bound metal-dependent hydrolase YbcI (DUF457 family)